MIQTACNTFGRAPQTIRQDFRIGNLWRDLEEVYELAVRTGLRTNWLCVRHIAAELESILEGGAHPSFGHLAVRHTCIGLKTIVANALMTAGG